MLTNRTSSLLISAIVLIFLLSDSLLVSAQDRPEPNYDEMKVPSFELPPLLVDPSNGKAVQTVTDWNATQRPSLLKLLKEEMYGSFPGAGLKVDFIVNSSDLVFGDSAIRKEVTISVSNEDREEVDVRMLIYLPNTHAMSPVFLGLNYYGNHTIINDPGITIHRSWARNSEDFGITNNRVNAKSRGVRNHRWPVKHLISQGFGLATMYYGEIDPDMDDGFKNGIHSLLDDDVDKSELSSISAWAWMLSQGLTYLIQDPQINGKQVAVIGHSRLGKTSLWAGVMDSRFGLVISNDSGCGGAALSRRRYGETVGVINHAFPHWFNDKFNDYNDAEDALPFDQHTLLSLVAPRPLYVASAVDDRWADPKGEFLSARFASEVYDLHKVPSLSGHEMPMVDTPDAETYVGYHVRTGGHDITFYDWTQFIAFAKRHFD